MFVAGGSTGKSKKNRFEYFLVDEDLGLYRAERGAENWWLWQEEGSSTWYAGTDKAGLRKPLPVETWAADCVEITWSCAGGCNRTGLHLWCQWSKKTESWGDPFEIPIVVAEVQTLERAHRPLCCGWFNPERDADPSDSEEGQSSDHSGDESPGVGAGAPTVPGGVWGPPGPPPGPPP